MGRKRLRWRLMFLLIALGLTSIYAGTVFYSKFTQSVRVKELILLKNIGSLALFSPDGQRLAFISSMTGKPYVYTERPEIHIVDLSGIWDNLHPRKLTTFGVGREYPGFTWNNLKPKRLTTTGIGDTGYRGFNWSPDGEKIIYLSKKGLCIIDMNGNERVIRKSGGDSPNWSPDGKMISFHCAPPKWKRGTGEGGSIRVIDVESGKEKVLTTGTKGWHNWSPDGTKIVYTSKENDGYDLWIMNSDGGNKIRLTKDEYADFPIWSPDGSKIAYISCDPKRKPRKRSAIWVMDNDGTNKIKLTPDEDIWHTFTWSPDGTKLAYVRWSPNFVSRGSYDIWVMNSDGGGKMELIPKIPWDGDPSWSPDGKKIVFHMGNDIWLAVLE